jgi:hypothetical protein
VSIERRPEHSLIAGAACPGGVSPAVAEASLMSYEHLAAAELVSVGASSRRASDPRPGGRMYKVADAVHTLQFRRAVPHQGRPRSPGDWRRMLRVR